MKKATPATGKNPAVSFRCAIGRVDERSVVTTITASGANCQRRLIRVAPGTLSLNGNIVTATSTRY